MSFALLHQNKHKQASTQAKHTPHHRINNFAMDSHDSIILLQPTIGNQAVGIMRSNIGFDFGKIDIQPKFKVSQHRDEYEQEADRISEQVMRMSDSDSTTSSGPNKEEGKDLKFNELNFKKMEGEKKNIKININTNLHARNLGVGVSKGVTNDITDAVRSGGSSLDSDNRRSIESYFGYDFSKVRIHTNERVCEFCRGIERNCIYCGK